MISVSPNALPGLAGLSLPALARLLKRVSRAVGIDGEVDVLLASDAELRRLNRKFRGRNKATDVLSFPAEAMPGLPAEKQHAGDLAISLETAAKQAAEHAHSLATEVRVLMLHGMLHLAGMDHETDAGEMREREMALRHELRLPTSLIERATLSVATSRTTTGAVDRAQRKVSAPAAKARSLGTVVAAKRDHRR